MEDLISLFLMGILVGLVVMAALAFAALLATIAAICVFGAAAHGFAVTMWRSVLHRGGASAAQGPDEPAFRAYYRGQVWSDLNVAAVAGWKRAGDETRRIQALDAVQGTEWQYAVFRKILLVYGYVGLIVGALLGALVGVIPALLIALVAALAHAIGAPLRAIEALRRKRRGTHFDCPECHDRFPLPVYVCPTCDAKHHQLAPGAFGVLRHRCTCASRLPALQWLGRERLVSECPSGHLLGESVGTVRTFHVPVAGGPSTGKSTFLAGALLGLEQAGPDGTLSTTVQSSSRDGYDRLLAGFRNGLLPTKTVDLQAPALVAEVRGKDKSALLYAYDVAGEAYGDEQELRRDPGYGLAEGVVLLVDPFALERVRAELGDELAAQPDLRPSPEPPQRVLERLVGVLDEKGIDMSRVPAAICVTKCDGLGIGAAIDEAPGADADARVRAWLEAQGAGNLLRSAAGTFKEVRCFSASALGRSPGAGTGPFTPVGTLEPLLWLLTTAGVQPAAAGEAQVTQTQRMTGAKPLDVAPKRPLFATAINAIAPLPIATNFVIGLLAFGSLAFAALSLTPGSDVASGRTLAAFNENDDAENGTSPGSTPPASASPSQVPPPPPSPEPEPLPPGESDTSTTSSPAGNPNSPSHILQRHFERISSGDYAGAFALMSSRYRSSNPDWTTQPSLAQPYINVVELGPSRFGAQTAHVHIKFYGRDRNDTPKSDTICRRFEGDARLVKQGSAWRYDPTEAQYDVTELPSSLDVCSP